MDDGKSLAASRAEVKRRFFFTFHSLFFSFMNSERWRQINRLFEAAIELAPDERSAFINQICRHDENLREELESLLASHEEAEGFLEKPAVGEVAEAVLGINQKLKKNQSIGHYLILSELGKGGQGAVYKAFDTRLNRIVALKTLPSELTVDETARKRFRREAQLASALDHPNICTIHDLIEIEGTHFIVMQFVEGETLSQKLKRAAPIDLHRALLIAIQIADALAAAHAQGVIHRDIKPANIVITNDNQIRILDFGLAKNIEEPIDDKNGSQSLTTESGIVLGTAAYMSPEQIRVQKTDARADIWSFGVVFYEMLTGRQPFVRDSLAETLATILAFEPSFEHLPWQIQKIVAKALRKKCDERYQTVKELLADLRELEQEMSFEEKLRSRDLHLSSGTNKQKWTAATATGFGGRRAVWAVLLFIILSVGGWFYWQKQNLNRARENVRRVEELAQADKTFEAYDLALQVNKYLPDEPTILSLMPTISDHLTVTSEPAGAKVFLRRFQIDATSKFPEREFVGATPVENRRIARGQYLLYVEKDGYATFARSISGRLPNYTTDLIAQPPVEIKVELVEAEKAPPQMAFVPGGEYKIVSYSRSTENPVRLDDFLIDKYEVRNREFKEFVAAGGYLRKDFWKFPFLKDGRQLSFDEAMREFKDKTGLSAPRSWSNQNFPADKADHPVTDITWHEAAAYAEFRGKSLPTIFQWEKAARDGKFDEGFNTMPWGLSRESDSIEHLANFRSGDTLPVESFEFGASPYGCLNMAGNVAEWMLNRRGENLLVGGGAWGEQPYSFGYYGDFPAFYGSNRIGFRLVKNLTEDSNGAEPLPPLEIPVFQKSSEAGFKTWLPHYAYDTDMPLEAEIVETTENDAWRREKITFVGANRERVLAYLYLPKNYPRPLQVVHWIPAADVPLGFSSLPHSVESFLAPVIKSGRAVFAVVLRGYNERPYSADYKASPGRSVEYRKEMVNRVTDWRRGLDYLATRSEIDSSRIAFLGLSNGANLGIILTAIENRYRSVALIGSGMRKNWLNWIAEANMINFAPHIRPPKLMLTGRYDEAHPLKTEAEPTFKLLREPKRLVVSESGHVPPPEIFAPIINNWLDETLEKVKNE